MERLEGVVLIDGDLAEQCLPPESSSTWFPAGHLSEELLALDYVLQLPPHEDAA